MTIILPTLAVAFAAFCVLLTVRIVNRRERWAKCTLATVVGLPVLYFASFGPACWWFASDAEIAGIRYAHQAPTIYWPITWIYLKSPRATGIPRLIAWFATRRYGIMLLPTDASGREAYLASD